MARGIAGYGRYDDDPGHVGCPFAKSDMTPCIARDGHTALSSGGLRVCVGCGHAPGRLITDLGREYPPARGPQPANPVAAARKLTELVRAATEPLAKGKEEPDGAQ
jgi:hypothetical protein